MTIDQARQLLQRHSYGALGLVARLPLFTAIVALSVVAAAGQSSATDRWRQTNLSPLERADAFAAPLKPAQDIEVVVDQLEAKPRGQFLGLIGRKAQHANVSRRGGRAPGARLAHE